MRKPKPRLSEQQLIEAILNKQSIGAHALYDMYSASLLGIIKRTIINEQLAQDVLQEAFIKIWYNIHKYDAQKGRLFTWMINITRNLAIDQIRRKANRDHFQLENLDENCIGSLVIDHYSNRCDNARIRMSLNTLKPIERCVLDLLYYQGMTQSEVGKALEIPIGTIKSHARLGLLKLRALYARDTRNYFNHPMSA